jgi:hypothetical protein
VRTNDLFFAAVEGGATVQLWISDILSGGSAAFHGGVRRIHAKGFLYTNHHLYGSFSSFTKRNVRIETRGF